MPYPRPENYTNFRDWGSALIREVERVQRDPGGEFNTPRPVALSHMGGNPASNLGIERATIDGILMYDPETDTVRVSVGGAWYYLVPVATYP